MEAPINTGGHMGKLGIGIGLIVALASAAWAQSPLFAVNDVVQIGTYLEVTPRSGFGFDKNLKCGIGFGGTVKVIYVYPSNTEYFVQYTPTTNPRGVLNECKGLTAYFDLPEQELVEQQGRRDAIVANPPV
jgi:hypothetical protein